MRIDSCFTPVYSPFSIGETLTPGRARRIYHEMCVKRHWPRETYPALPWPMEDLVGTTWRNIHCGTLAKVVALQRDRWDNLVLPIQWEHCWGSVMWWLGLWTDDRQGGRYVIEHWVRVDQLPVEDQLPWFGFHLDWLQAQISEDIQRLAECTPSGDRINRQWRIEDLARDRREAAYAEMQLHAFAKHVV